MNSPMMSVTTADGSPAAPALRIDASGWEEAEALYDRYGALAYTLAYRIVQDRGVAEDVVQEAFLAVWKNAASYEPGRASMRTWLCRIVRNRAIDRRRGTAGRQRDDRSLSELTTLCSTADVFSDVVQRDEARSIVAALAALPAAQREAIELAYYGGYSQTEIAAMTAQPLGTVKSRTRLAMRALAASLAPLRSPDVMAAAHRA